MFLESILFLQKLKNFKNSVAQFWWLSRGSSKSYASATSSHVNFGDLFASETSNREGYTEIFAAQLATPSRVDLPIAKNTWKIFSQFCLRVFWRLALATYWRLTSVAKNVCFAFRREFLKFFSAFSLEFLWLFTVFPISLSTVFDPNTQCHTSQSPFLLHAFSNLQETGMGFLCLTWFPHVLWTIFLFVELSL